jgi:hypothetical protein
MTLRTTATRRLTADDGRAEQRRQLERWQEPHLRAWQPAALATMRLEFSAPLSRKRVWLSMRAPDSGANISKRIVARARSHLCGASPLTLSIPDPLIEWVPLFLKRQCDRTLLVAHQQVGGPRQLGAHLCGVPGGRRAVQRWRAALHEGVAAIAPRPFSFI